MGGSKPDWALVGFVGASWALLELHWDFLGDLLRLP